MSDSRVVGGLERLPWLADEPVRRSAPENRRSWNVTGWVAAAVALVAAVSFWLGTRTPTQDAWPSARPSATVAVPPPKPVPMQEAPAAPQQQVAPVAVPQIRVVRVPEIRLVPVPSAKTPEAPEVSAAPDQTPVKPAANDKPLATPGGVAKAPAEVPLRPWQPRVVAGAAGRLVQIGAFGSVVQAKQGWRYMVRTYPAVAHLPAVVRPDRNSKGRTFYRFRIGTTSQAHSEVLCQRMEKIGLSCAVVGLPWKAKVER
jgi:hypothetical protein